MIFMSNFFKNVALVTLCGGATVLGVKSCVRDIDDCINVKNCKEQVRATGISSQDFEQLERSLDKNTDLIHTTRSIGWQHALDSLKMKAAVEKAYIEGANMVRDSIKTAAKSIK